MKVCNKGEQPEQLNKLNIKIPPGATVLRPMDFLNLFDFPQEKRHRVQILKGTEVGWTPKLYMVELTVRDKTGHCVQILYYHLPSRELTKSDYSTVYTSLLRLMMGIWSKHATMHMSEHVVKHVIHIYNAFQYTNNIHGTVWYSIVSTYTHIKVTGFIGV